MKKMIYTVLLFSAVIANAQPIISEKTKTACIYELYWRFDTTQPDYYRKENMLLMIGDSHSLFESYNTYKFDYQRANSKEHISEWLCKHTADYITAYNFHIYKNMSSNSIITTDHALMEGDFIYEEKVSDFVWDIHRDTATIRGYHAQKATTSFGGREWEAWFAKEIPFKDGPYKFCGLPGLIVKLQDTREHYTFIMSSIEEPEEGMEIELDTSLFTRTTKKEFFKIEDDIRANIISYARRAEIAPESQQTIVRNISSDNNPIETDRK